MHKKLFGKENIVWKIYGLILSIYTLYLITDLLFIHKEPTLAHVIYRVIGIIPIPVVVFLYAMQIQWLPFTFWRVYFGFWVFGATLFIMLGIFSEELIIAKTFLIIGIFLLPSIYALWQYAFRMNNLESAFPYAKQDNLVQQIVNWYFIPRKHYWAPVLFFLFMGVNFIFYVVRNGAFIFKFCFFEMESFFGLFDGTFLSRFFVVDILILVLVILGIILPYLAIILFYVVWSRQKIYKIYKSILTVLLIALPISLTEILFIGAFKLYEYIYKLPRG